MRMVMEAYSYAPKLPASSATFSSCEYVIHAILLSLYDLDIIYIYGNETRG
jgi:hypothetical protein